jgi:hypothetical protein
MKTDSEGPSTSVAFEVGNLSRGRSTYRDLSHPTSENSR